MRLPSGMLAILGNAGELFSAGRDNGLMTVLLILVLSMALVVCLVCLLVVVHFLRSSRRRRELSLRPRLLPRNRECRPTHSAVPSRWLAIRSDDPQEVQSALGLLRPRPCSWEEGLSAAHHQKLFISPSVSGWILVLGSGLPEPAQDVDKCFHFITALSRKLGQIQFFSANRILHHHAWVNADQGKIIRAYAWAGKTLWLQGRITRAELELRLKCLDYAQPASRPPMGQTDPCLSNTERVSLLAARWSVDPASIDSRMLRESQGIAGELSRSRTR